VDREIERQLIRGSLAGDRSASEQLIRGHSKRVLAVCLAVVGNVHDAEDVAQEALLRGLGRLHQLRNDERFGAWMARIARNLSIDFVRRRKLRGEAEAWDPEPGSGADEYGDLYDAIARLPEDYRLPLILYYFDGRCSESVAETLGMSPAGVLTRLSRARKELRNLLGSKEVCDE
jgi:RNA polymerase sigma-70 factor (ECF subfamily)